MDKELDEIIDRLIRFDQTFRQTHQNLTPKGLEAIGFRLGIIQNLTTVIEKILATSRNQR